MIYKGIAKGKLIELEQALPYVEGQPVNVSVEPLAGQPVLGAPASIRLAMKEPPHLKKEDVDELERLIAEAKLPVQQRSIFEGEGSG